MTASNRRTRRAAAARARRLPWGAWEGYDVTAEDQARHGNIAARCAKAFTNGRFVALVYETPTAWGTVLHLAVRSADERMPSWADLQRIKDDLVGSDRTAVQVHPSEDRLVDEADMFHLWVLPRDVELPFGLHEGAPAWGRA